MRNIISKVICLILSMVFVFAIAGCNKKTDANTITFWVKGSAEELNMYTELKDTFNSTYGKDHGINVDLVVKPIGNYDQAILVMHKSSSGPDVFLMEDDKFKSWVIGGYIAEIQQYLDGVTDIDLGQIMPTSYERLRYNKEANTSNSDDPLYGLPIDPKPTALYYNQSLLEKAGIIVISVDEENLDAWNRNEIKDNNGKYKSDFAKLNNIKVPKKGYYRSEHPYYYDGEYTKQWVKPDFSTEVAVLNNRIPMNWDEIEDIAMLFSGDYNPKPGDENKTSPQTEFGTYYGYFTENWFNYGWSVGGDCLEDLTGNGDWNFSLLDPTKNYIVKEGKTYTGEYTGRIYQGGETINLKDKLNIPKGETLVPDDYGNYKYNGVIVGNRPSAIAEAENEDGSLLELPSTKEAFTRYLKLGASKTANIDGENGLNISPNPSTYTNKGGVNYFVSGGLAIWMERSSFVTSVANEAKNRGFTWDVMPLVRYKEYTNPADPNCDEVKVQGVIAGHSRNFNLVIRGASDKKDKAAAFVKWAAGVEGQKLRAHLGFFPNQKDLYSELVFQNGKTANNIRVFSEALEYQRPGDWWYMPDTLWVEAWCVDLNAEVRNGQKTYASWYSPAIQKANNRLKNYKTFKM